jgi:hypothetical protein
MTEQQKEDPRWEDPEARKMELLTLKGIRPLKQEEQDELDALMFGTRYGVNEQS